MVFFGDASDIELRVGLSWNSLALGRHASMIWSSSLAVLAMTSFIYVKALTNSLGYVYSFIYIDSASFIPIGKYI